MKKFELLVLGLLICCPGKGQPKTADLTNALPHSFVRLYLQTDRDAYLSGDTIRAKGFFTNTEHRSVTPQSMTLELLDLRAGKIIATHSFLPFRGAFPASLALPFDLSTGTYRIRAYSGDLIQEDQAVFTRLIKVYSRTKKKNDSPVYDKALVFYPEGGRLIAGATNKVAFKFADETGVPFDISGRIVDASGKKIVDFKSVHNGMGFFMLNPKAGAPYFAVMDSGFSAHKYPLPVAADKGIVLKVSNDGSRLLLNIQVSSAGVLTPAFMVLQGGSGILHRANLQTDSAAYRASIDIGGFPSGVARLGIYSKDTQLLAERLCFIDNKEYRLAAGLSTPLLNSNPRAENLLSLDLKEPVKGTFAVSVVDAGFGAFGTDRQNIYSANLLTCYLENSVYDAGSYLDGSYQNAKELLDLVMLTSHWGISKWEHDGKRGTSVKKEKGILSGTVFYKTTKKIYANKPIHLIAVSEEDSSTKTISFQTDSAGAFDLKGLGLSGRNKLLFSPADKKGGFIDVVLDPANEGSLDIKFPHVRAVENSVNNADSPALDRFIGAKDYIENVTVSAKMKDRLQMLEQRYATGKFRDLYGEIYDLTDLKPRKGNILDYLMARYPDIKVGIDSIGGYHVKARDRNGEFVLPSIYINEVQALPPYEQQLFSVSPHDVAMIKLVQGIDLGGRGPIPSIAIYTRKGRDFNAASENYDIEYVEGYTKASTFYSPVYAGENPGGPTDRRITLFWNPRAATSDRVHFIPVHFYNTDFTKRFLLIIEGVTENGKLLSFGKALF
ncbi:MG2 domain-containing protein [Niabella aurantiaca]|uniref:MG2 domain-containing protein n=1 Tax=Niabella aurantiaca TaxID=379900 RepID=UPI00037D250D|nr:MG2 domain-containing protein [Niabella aurantiaca]